METENGSKAAVPGLVPLPEGPRLAHAAHHEAAHAVVAWKQGLRVFRITLDPVEANASGISDVALTESEAGTHAECARVFVAGWLWDENIFNQPAFRRMRVQGIHVDLRRY